MSNYRKYLVAAVSLFVLILGTAGVIQAKPAELHPFADEAGYLELLRFWPHPGWNPNQPVLQKDYLTLLEKLINGRSLTPLSTQLGKMNVPNAHMTHETALTLAGICLGWKKEESYTRMRELTGELKKSADAAITGYDMAYIFCTLLQTKRVGQQKILLEERYVVGLDPMVVSRVMQVSDKAVILEDEGALPLAKDAQIFWMRDGKVSPLPMNHLAVGMSNLKFMFNAKKEVQTIVLYDQHYPETIRVLLSEELNPLGSSKSYDFKEVQVTATQPFKIVAREHGKDRVILVAETGEVITFTAQNEAVGIAAGKFKTAVKTRVYLKSYLWHNISFDPLISTARQSKVPVYAGTLELIPAKKPGYLHLVNELPMEMYLRKVVSAQIPAAWGLEAAKIQAIAARSYAIAQLSYGKFSDKGAHVDDSNATQIYHNSQEHAVAVQAIDATKGMVIAQNGNVIDAVFFSCSAGLTANSEEVWHNERTGEFPGIPVPYLRSRSLFPAEAAQPLTTEADIAAFLRRNTDPAFDAKAPFYRWNVTLTRSELERSITQGLIERERADRAAGTDFVQTLQGMPIDPANAKFTIGTLRELKVVQRGEGGNIMTLDIVAGNGTYRVKKEYNIRLVIRPRKDYTGSAEEVRLLLNDGTVLKDYSLLPSTFAAFEPHRDAQGALEKVTIYGGGNGHGVGMSLWAVRGMLEAGYSTEEIFRHFYTGVKIEKVY